MSAGDINNLKIFLSGGPSNTDPDLSYGGEVSITILGEGENNLFDNVSQTNAKSGYIDYRCIYIENLENIYNFYNIKIASALQGPVQVGTIYRNNVEGFSFSFSPSLSPANPNRTFELNYEYSNTPIVLTLHDNISTFISTAQTAIRTIPDLSNATITATDTRAGPNLASRYFEIIVPNRTVGGIECENINLPNLTLNHSLTQKGSPINAVAENTFSTTNAPNNVSFGQSLTQTIPKLEPGDRFYFWLRRTTPPNTTAKDNALEQISMSVDLTG